VERKRSASALRPHHSQEQLLSRELQDRESAFIVHRLQTSPLCAVDTASVHIYLQPERESHHTKQNMSPTPPSTGSSTGNSPDTQYRVVRKRNRVPLSCAPCRHKKCVFCLPAVSGPSLTPHSSFPFHNSPHHTSTVFWTETNLATNRLKCNRSIPCENCIRRGDAAGCAYAAPGPRRKAAPAGSSPDDMQNRIDRLEGLVLSLMTNGSTAPGPTAAVAAVASERSGSTSTSTAVDDGEMEKIKEEEEYGEGEEGGESDVDAVANSFGVLKVDADTEKSMYIGDSHWHLVLSDVSPLFPLLSAHLLCIRARWLRPSKIELTVTRSRKFAITSPTTNASSITSTKKLMKRAPRAGSRISYSKGWHPRRR
jgi:hypothetical protein